MNEETSTPIYDEQGNVVAPTNEATVTTPVATEPTIVEVEPQKDADVDTSKNGNEPDAKVLDKIRREETEKWAERVRVAEAKEREVSENFVKLQTTLNNETLEFNKKLTEKDTLFSTKVAELESAKKLAEETLVSYKTEVEIGSFKTSLASQLQPEFKELLNGETKETLQANFDKLKQTQDSLFSRFSVQPVPTPAPSEKLQEKALGLKDIQAMSQSQYNAYAKAQIAKGQSPLAMLPN